jgi:hypothetical protein
LSLLPFDLTEVVHEELARQRRPNDFLLHASSHIDGPLRHTQLDVAGAPKVKSELLSEITLFTGTMWHEWLHNTLRRLGVPYMAEVNLTPWLPEGWAGTADAVVWNPDLKAFVLIDFKTQKGEGMRFIAMGGAKDAHKLQASAYWHALKKMGIPLAKAIGVFYLPKNDVRGKDPVEPILADFEPYPAKALHKQMEERRQRVTEYRNSLPFDAADSEAVALWASPSNASHVGWVTDELAPVSEREQRLYRDRVSGSFELKLMPHWSTAYCPYDDELCDCSTQGSTKIGYFDIDGTYYARPGYEEIEPTVFPS